jgi:hypothetical protein
MSKEYARPELRERVTCGRCGVSFKVGPPPQQPEKGTTVCAEPHCAVPFWHRIGRDENGGKVTYVGVYAIDVAAHGGAWTEDGA